MKQTLPSAAGPIGIFDSGYGGLTILSKIREALPQYDYIYLGDNARAPYGTRSFEIVYEFTLQAVTNCSRWDAISSFWHVIQLRQKPCATYK